MVLSAPLLVHLFILGLDGLSTVPDGPTKSSGAAKKDKEPTRLQRVGGSVGVAPWKSRVPGLCSGGKHWDVSLGQHEARGGNEGCRVDDDRSRYYVATGGGLGSGTDHCHAVCGFTFSRSRLGGMRTERGDSDD